jgi:hypothetical protein
VSTELSQLLTTTPQFSSQLALEPCYKASGPPQQETQFSNNTGIVVGVLTDPLPSNGHPSIVDFAFILRNVFMEPLPSSELFLLSGVISQYFYPYTDVFEMV